MLTEPIAPAAVDGDAPPGLARTLVFATMAVTLSIIGCLTLAEVVLRFLPVATGLAALPVNAAHPVYRFDPDRPFVFSRDWNFSIVNHGRTNNDGFVNDEAYVKDDPRPLLAVIGDSYVEAAMVPNARTFYRRQAEALGTKGRVYSFGASGAPLSQYLVWARHAAKTYAPTGLVIVVVGNDFDESLLAYNHRPGLHVYARDVDQRLHLTRIDYVPSSLRLLARHSALARYLIFNLNALEVAGTLLDRLRPATPAHAATPDYVGNTAAAASPQRIRDSEAAVDAFLADLATMVPLPAERIAFLLDGARYASDVAFTEQSYFGHMRTYFMGQAARRGHEVIDLQPWFLARGRDGTARFEFPTDGHWNALGHEVAAQALAASRLYRTVFGPN